jgi:hypothetical protein
MVEACPSRPAWHLRGPPAQGLPPPGVRRFRRLGLRRLGPMHAEPRVSARHDSPAEIGIIAERTSWIAPPLDLQPKSNRRTGPNPASRERGPPCPPAACPSANNRPPGPRTTPTGTFPVREPSPSPAWMRSSDPGLRCYGSPHQIDAAGRLDQLADFQSPLPGRFWVPADNSFSWLMEAPTHPTTFPCTHTVHRAQSLTGILIIAWGC